MTRVLVKLHIDVIRFNESIDKYALRMHEQDTIYTVRAVFTVYEFKFPNIGSASGR